MIRIAFLALAAMSTPVMAQTPAALSAKLLTWHDLTERPKPLPDATIDYGTDPMQKVDVWLPKGKTKGPFPVVVMVHGGCWTTDIADRSLMNWIADDLRNTGVAVWNIDYRGVDRTGGGYPGTFADAAKAADQLAANAKKFNLDTRRVLAIGHSAGGHLALWLAARTKLPASSVLHTNADNGCGTEVVAKLVGASTPQHPDVYADTSVPRLLPLGVKQDLINGREDRIIPAVMATDYIAKARAAGDTATLHTIPATGHVELIAPETPAWAEAKRLILSYFGKTQ
jgi:acetyl esterase/lipase